MGNDNSIAIDNTTTYALHVIIMQVGPLLDAIVPKESMLRIDCKARVFFTVAVSKAPADPTPVRITNWDVAKPIVLVTSGTVLAAATGCVLLSPLRVTVGCGAAVLGLGVTSAAATTCAVNARLARRDFGCMSANCSLLAGYMNQEEWNDARELQEAFVSNCQPNTSWEDLNHHLVHLDAIFKAKGIEQSEIDELMREVQYHFFDSCYDILVIPDGDDDNFRVAVRNGKDKALLSVSDDSWDYLQEFTRELEAISKARSPHMILRCVENAESVLAGYWRKFKSPTEPTPPEALAEWMELGLYQANILNMHSILNYLARFQEALPDHLQYLYRTLAGMVGVIEQRATGGRSYKYLGIGTRPCYATKYGVYANGKTTVHVEEDVNGFLVLRTSHDVS